MKKIKRAKVLKMLLLIVSLIMFSTLSIITYAWFTDKKEYLGTLNFGTIELDVSGGVDNSSKTLNLDIERAYGPDYSGKLMPGDTVKINLNIGLKSTSEPAYYLAYIYDDIGVFEDVMFFSDGTKTGENLNVYINNFEKVYLQSDASQASVKRKYYGSLTNEYAHNITISAKVSEDYETQKTTTTVKCKIYAVQQANTTMYDVSDAISPVAYFPNWTSWKSAISNVADLTSIGFYEKEDTTSLAGYAQDGILRPNIEIWKKSDTEIAFVSDRVIRPDYCAYLFSDKATSNQVYLKNLESITFKNFDTRRETSMNSMFYKCKSLKSLDLSGFKTKKVTDMASMFEECEKLTNLNISNFDTSNVTTMERMFLMTYINNNLTSLDISNFNTSKVTNMDWMFAGCSKLTSLDVSNFDTSGVTNMRGMFGECNELTSLDLSNFNTSSVTNMSSMFQGCNELTSLDLSNFNTSSVTNMSGMFNGTFSNAPSSSTLNISSNFTYKVGEVNTQFASKTELNTQTSLNTNVTVLKDGVALS